MKIDVKKQDANSTSMSIEGEMTIYTINELKKSFLENSKNCSELDIDLSKVTKMDTAGFQLLYLAKRNFKEREISLKIIEPSREVEDIFNLYGESY